MSILIVGLFSALSYDDHHSTSTMASEGPDPQCLKSWEDAFQYPIPTVRRVEQELRRDIASNKEKLRALVGYVAEQAVKWMPLLCSWLMRYFGV